MGQAGGSREKLRLCCLVLIQALTVLLSLFRFHSPEHPSRNHYKVFVLQSCYSIRYIRRRAEWEHRASWPNTLSEGTWFSNICKKDWFIFPPKWSLSWLNRRLLLAYLSLVPANKQLLLKIFHFCHSVEPKEAIDIVNIRNLVENLMSYQCLHPWKTWWSFSLSLKWMISYEGMLIRNCVDFRKMTVLWMKLICNSQYSRTAVSLTAKSHCWIQLNLRNFHHQSREMKEARKIIAISWVPSCLKYILIHLQCPKE